VSDKAKKALGDEGYDPVYGARPLKRVISRQLENPVSRMIISGEIVEGKHLEVDYDPEQMQFRFKATF
jgi:ATP-dependent Clp protease ATP-binding subunit ClpB